MGPFENSKGFARLFRINFYYVNSAYFSEKGYRKTNIKYKIKWTFVYKIMVNCSF